MFNSDSFEEKTDVEIENLIHEMVNINLSCFDWSDTFDGYVYWADIRSNIQSKIYQLIEERTKRRKENKGAYNGCT